MSAKRFADQLDDQICYAGIGDCPQCGYGLPGPHRKYCPVRAAFLRLEREVATDAGRKAVTRAIRAILKRKEV